MELAFTIISYLFGFIFGRIFRMFTTGLNPLMPAPRF